MINSNFNAFKKQITHPIKFRVFLLKSLPSAWFAGLRVVELSEKKSCVSIQYKWFNKNPFNSIYFAMLSAAAEVSTGILCMGNIYKRNPGVSMLVTQSSGKFFKKATGKINFICNDGDAINTLVEEAIATGEGREITCISKGTNQAGEVVAEFMFTWSFKVKQSK